MILKSGMVKSNARVELDPVDIGDNMRSDDVHMLGPGAFGRSGRRSGVK